MYIHLGEPTHTPAPPKGIVLPPPPPPVSAPAPAQGAQPLRLPSAPAHSSARHTVGAIRVDLSDRRADREERRVLRHRHPHRTLSRAHVRPRDLSPAGSAHQRGHRLPWPERAGLHCRVKSDGWAVSPAYRGNNCNTAGEDYGIIRLSCPMNQGFVPLRAFDPTILGGATVSLAGYPWVDRTKRGTCISAVARLRVVSPSQFHWDA